MSKCPLCGCETFYCKDPEDEYETYELSFPEGGAAFAEEPPEGIAVEEGTELFCNRCAWRGKQGELK